MSDVTPTILANNLLLLGLACLHAFDMYRSKKARERNNRKMEEISKKQDVIHDLVNRPMGVALNSLAIALEQMARMTGKREDIMAAVNARSAADAHAATQAKIDAAAREDEANKEKIIADFMAKQKDTT